MTALLLLLVAVLTAAAVSDSNVCPAQETFPIKEMIAGVNQMMEKMLLTHGNNFTEVSLGSHYEIQFSGFTGIIRPRNGEPASCESLCKKEDQLEALGYTNKNGSYYKFHEEALDWWTANRTCVEEGAHLVVLNSEEEAQIVVDIFNEHASRTVLHTEDDKKIYIGANDLQEEGHFVTVLGDELSQAGYAKFWAGNPDDWKGANPLGEDCVELGRPDLLLNDIHCDTKLAFVCETEWTRSLRALD